MSTAERHSRIGELFLAVCDLSKDDQTTSLDHLCANDPGLRTEVAALLEQDSRAEDLIAMRARRLAETNISNVSRSGYADAIVTQPQGYDGRRTVTPPMDPAGLPTIPGFEILGVLGHGGMGIVYRARQLQLGREVALKVLPAMLTSASPMIVERFKREAAAAAQLRHRNIVPVYDFGRCDDCYYYAMELVAGAPLNVVIRQLADNYTATLNDAVTSDVTLAAATKSAVAGLPWLGDDEQPFGRGYFNRVARWMASVADALHLAHEHGIVHRDIKPGNLMVSHDREIMVTDFGLVMTDHEAPITKAGAIMGTLRYLSPEQALGGRVPVDHRTDIYSLGATLYELLALQPLFCASDDKQLLAAVIGQEPRRPSELNPTVPADLETVCLKALEKLPENRYHTAKDLAEDLAAFVEDRPISARRPPVRVRAARFIRRHVVGLLVGACLVIFAGGGVVAVGGHRKARVAEKVNELISQGLVLQQEQRWDEAAAAYRAATELDPRNVRALGNLAIIRKEQFNTQAQRDPLLLEEANAYCDAALAVAPGHAGIWNVKGVVLKKLGRLEESAGAYRTALSSETVEPEMRIAIHNNLAEAQWLMGDHDAAEANVRAAAQIAEATGTPAWFAWQDLAALELAYGNPEAAEYVRKGFEAKGGSHWRLHVTRARVCLEIEETKDVERAVRDVYAALEHGPADPRIERTAAIALLRANSFEEAAEHARKAIELGDVPSYAYLVLSIAEARLGQNEQGREHYRAAIDSWPTELDEGQYLVSTEQGMLWLDTRWQLQEWVEEAQVLLHEDDRR